LCTDASNYLPYCTGSTKKPEDMYRIIEHFALGKRRLELFGEDHNIRPGWLTLGKGLSYSNFNKEVKRLKTQLYAHIHEQAVSRVSHIVIVFFRILSAKKTHSYRHMLRTLQTRMVKYGRVEEILLLRLLT
jgi:hypothetical protein